MMLSQRQRLVLASLLACTALAVAGRAYMRATSGTSSRVIEREIPPQALARLDVSLLDTKPTAETVSTDVQRAAEHVKRTVSTLPPEHRIPDSRHADLVDAFSAWLRMTLDGDADADRSWKLARGMAPPSVEVTDDVRAMWRASTEKTRLAPFGMESMEVRVIYRDGKRVAPEQLQEGFDTLRSQKVDADMKPLFPIPTDPERSRADIVEIRLPMSVKSVEKDEHGTVLMGYQFSWNNERKQWIPYCTVLYHVADGRLYTGHF